MKKVFCFGEILIRMSPANQGGWIKNASISSFLGGAELNVATALAHWDVPVQYCSALPDNDVSKEILAYLQEINIDTSPFIFSGNRIGLYFLPQGKDLKNAGVIYDRDNSSFSGLTPKSIDWDEQLKDADWFHFSAISPAINEHIATICMEALQAASRLGLKISVDLNYRSKLWKYGKRPSEIMNNLVSYCDVVMGNVWSANSLLDIPLDDESLKNDSKENLLVQNNSTAALIFKQFPKCKMLANTFRMDVEEGVHYFAVLNERDKSFVSKDFYLPKVVDKAGSGDCFMAGLIFSEKSGFSSQKTVDFSSKAAIGKMLEKGDSTRQSILDVENIEIKMSRNPELISRLIAQQGVIPLFYHEDAAVSISVVEALYKAGIRIIEYTNRGENALANFKALVQKRNESWPDLFLSAGTIKTVEDARNFIEAGADFIISPGVIPAVAKLVHEANLLWIPGCMTPSEIMLAEQSGAKWVKLFPGNLLGPSFVKGVKEIFPRLKFMPTGGVELTEQSVGEWFKAGVSAVGLGSKMMSEAVLSRKDYSEIETLARSALEIVHKVKH